MVAHAGPHSAGAIALRPRWVADRPLTLAPGGRRTDRPRYFTALGFSVAEENGRADSECWGLSSELWLSHLRRCVPPLHFSPMRLSGRVGFPVVSSQDAEKGAQNAHTA